MTTDDPTTTRPTGECHPACKLLPELDSDQFAELVKDIEAHGQRHPVIVDDQGVILDGRHRWKACWQLGREPHVKMFIGTEQQKVALVMSENIHRRHLNESQRALIGTQLERMFAEAAKERMLAGKADPMAPVPHGTARDQAATAVGVSGRTIQDAKLVTGQAEPEAIQAIQEGKSTVKAEARKIRERKPKPKPKATNRQGYVMPDREKKAGPNLLEALGRLVAFTPTSARRYLADNPDDAPKVKHVLASAIRVIDALREALLPPPETEPPLAPPEPVTDDRQMDLEDFTEAEPSLAPPEPTEEFAEEMADEMPQPNGELRNGYADDPSELGRRVREARIARNWTQGELAEAAGTHGPIISQIENGKLGKVGKATLQRVAAAVL
jgi:ParB-like chromosome segregation protein Spo0J/DNA-binding XRE family transcriptional regulator